ncbi:hypothetical protein AGDE_12487 [Angomonas deanei]|nr:hypothetical protein AGDE_12487 [Angomonas deanei]|eukprot:EPY24121.1 hypothetical protein AGDE_12487 [Angomonas deanei]
MGSGNSSAAGKKGSPSTAAQRSATTDKMKGKEEPKRASASDVPQDKQVLVPVKNNTSAPTMRTRDVPAAPKQTTNPAAVPAKDVFLPTISPKSRRSTQPSDAGSATTGPISPASRGKGAKGKQPPQVSRTGSMTSTESGRSGRSKSTTRPAARPGSGRPGSACSNRSRSSSASGRERGELIFRIFRTKKRVVDPVEEVASPDGTKDDTKKEEVLIVTENEFSTIVKNMRKETNRNLIALRKKEKERQEREKLFGKGEAPKEEVMTGLKKVSVGGNRDMIVNEDNYSLSEPDFDSNHTGSDLTKESYGSGYSILGDDAELLEDPSCNSSGRADTSFFDHKAATDDGSFGGFKPTAAPQRSEVNPPRLPTPSYGYHSNNNANTQQHKNQNGYNAALFNAIPAVPPRPNGPSSPRGQNANPNPRMVQYNNQFNAAVTNPVVPQKPKTLYYNKLTKKENYFNVHNHKLTNEEVAAKRAGEIAQYEQKRNYWPQPYLFGPPLPPEYQTVHSNQNNTAVFNNNNNNPRQLMCDKMDYSSIRWIKSPVRRRH